MIEPKGKTSEDTVKLLLLSLPALKVYQYTYVARACLSSPFYNAFYCKKV